MIININSKKMIEGEKPVFNFESISPVTIKTDQDFSSLSSSLYLAGSRAYGNSNKLLFLSKEYSINEDEVTFNVDTYTENYLKYVNEFKTPFNLEFGAFSDSKTIFLLDKAFANPRVYIEGVPPANLPDFYTKEESDERFATLSGLNEVSGNLATNYWNKYEVAQAIAQVETMKIVVVQELPPIEEAQEYTIYLVPSQDQSTGNVYDEYLVINGAYECIGSTAIDMSQYALLSGGNSFVGDQSISGDLTVSGSFIMPSGLTFINQNTGGIIDVNYQEGYLKQTHNSTYIRNRTILIEGRNDIGCKINVNPIAGHLQYKGHNENTPGGFVIQDLSGNISLTGDIIQNGVNYDLSGFLSKIESFNAPLSGDQADVINLNNNSHNIFNYSTGAGVGSINIGSYDGYTFYFRNYAKYFSVQADTQISLTAPNIRFNGNAQNTPGGFVIQDLSGNISLTGDIIQNGVNYDLSGFLSKFENFSLPSSGQEYLTQINVGGRNAISIYAGAGGFGYYTYIGSMYGFTDIKGIAINLFYSGYLGLNGHHENTPGGFVIQDLSGKISAPYIEATSGLIENNVNYNLANLQPYMLYTKFDSNSFTPESNHFYSSQSAKTQLNLTIPSGLTNCCIFFTTGNTFSFTATLDEGMYINEPFDIGPNGAYLIAIEKECVLWTQMEEK